MAKQPKLPPETVALLSKVTNAAPPPLEATAPDPQFTEPRILLIDCPEGATVLLRDDGYNAALGTFGRPYRVEMKNDYIPLVQGWSLPKLGEQQIVVIDFLIESIKGFEGRKRVARDAWDWWANCSRGWVDPRPRGTLHAQNAFDRAYAKGGVFVVFCEPFFKQDIWIARERFSRLEHKDEVEAHMWSFLSALNEFDFHSDEGEVIKPDRQIKRLSSLLAQHLKGAKFTTTLGMRKYRLDQDNTHEPFVPLLRNGHGDIVGGVLYNKETNGIVLLLPHLADKPKFIHALITSVLPAFAPDLYRERDAARWLERPEFQHPQVVALRRRQRRIRKIAKKRIADLEGEALATQARFDFMQGLLTSSDNKLKLHVKAALEEIGFEGVIDVDQLEDDPQEDLHVKDTSPAFLFEVKGVKHFVSESDALQVHKYVRRRCAEWGRDDLLGITIVNHQNGVDPFERNHEEAFTPRQVNDAKLHGTLLLTTSELHRFVRAMMKYGWPADAVKALFHGTGRIAAVPAHYQRVGTIDHYYDDINVVRIKLEATVRVDDQLGYSLPRGFVEEKLTSLEENHKKIVEADAGQLPGYKTRYRRSDLKVGLPVYVVKGDQRSAELAQ